MAQPARIRVLVGEDQPIVREGIVRVLEDSGLEVVGTAADARDLVRKARADRPDVVITDIQMPPDHTDDGLRAALEIRAAEPGVGVLVLSQTCMPSPTPFAGSQTAGRRSTPTSSPAWWGDGAGAAPSTA